MITFEEAQKHVCGDCRFFLHPEPSRLYDNISVTRCCPHSPHRLQDGGGYSTAGSRACMAYVHTDQLSIIMEVGVGG